MESVLLALRLNEMWVVPTLKNPLKLATQGASAEARVKAVRLALQTLNPEQFKLRDDEILNATEEYSYTVDTLGRFTKERTDTDFYLVIGADQLEAFDKWKNYKKILGMANLVVTSRPGSLLPKIKDELPAWLKSMVKSFRSGQASLAGGGKIHFVQLKDADVSSTDIRRRIRRKEVVSHLTPGPVAEYLVQENVYDPNEPLVSDYSEFAKFCASVLNDKGGIAVAAYDVREMTQPTEFTLVASGTSSRHAKALCEHVIKEAKERYGVHPQSTEGLQEGRWVIVDYGSLMVHVFYDFVRGEYHIEDLWAQAPRLSV
jgi:nicotinate-nucleotide adenylyltransferase